MAVLTGDSGEELPLSKVYLVCSRPYPDRVYSMHIDKHEAIKAAGEMNNKSGAMIAHVWPALIHIMED